MHFLYFHFTSTLQHLHTKTASCIYLCVFSSELPSLSEPVGSSGLSLEGVTDTTGGGLVNKGVWLLIVPPGVDAGGEITDGDFEEGDVGELSPKDAGDCGFSLSAIFWFACCLSLMSSRAATLASVNFSTNWSKENIDH